MHTKLATTKPFSLAQTITFLRRFPAVKDDYIVTDDSVTAALSIGGVGTWFTLRGDTEVTLETPDDAPAEVAKRAANFIGASDDLGAFYAAAAHDEPFRALVTELYGLHHVRFLTLAEIAVYCVMMQRNPITRAAAMKRKFLARFGRPVVVSGQASGRTLRAMPELAELVDLDGKTIGEVIGHARKGPMIETVVRGVAALGETFLATAPYATARDALLEIAGIGPFSAAAILLRGLGRMDELPVMPHFTDEMRALYGESLDESAIARRYGSQIGYWSFYLKTGMARRAVPVVRTVRRTPDTRETLRATVRP